MKLQVQSIHFNADKKLLDFVQRKADKLEQFFDHIIGAVVFLKLDKSEDEKNKISEIKINIPGATLFAKEQKRTFEEATDLAIESLQRQIKRHKEKMKSYDNPSGVVIDEVED